MTAWQKRMTARQGQMAARQRQRWRQDAAARGWSCRHGEPGRRKDGAAGKDGCRIPGKGQPVRRYGGRRTVRCAMPNTSLYRGVSGGYRRAGSMTGPTGAREGCGEVWTVVVWTVSEQRNPQGFGVLPAGHVCRHVHRVLQDRHGSVHAGTGCPNWAKAGHAKRGFLIGWRPGKPMDCI